METRDNQAIIPGVQGLRGLTALAVILFHMGWFWCGWLGVWVFFTVSGFVITRSLLRAEAAGRAPSLIGFYKARAGRIMPLYLAAVGIGVVALCVQARVFGQEQALGFLDHVPWLLTGTYNVFRAIPGYEQTELFGHLWSLSVEEQFYLLFPIAFLGLRRTIFSWLLLVLVALGPLVRLVTHLVFSNLGWTTSDVATAVYQLTFNHLDAFALGSLIALHEDRVRGWAGSPFASRLTWLIPVILACIAALCVVLQNLQIPTSGKDILTDAFAVKPELLSGQILVYALGSLGAGGLLVLILSGSGILRWLASDSLVRLGTVSYGLYVWHFPLLWIYTDAGQRTLVAAGLYVCATLSCALLSHRFLEQPARRWLEERWASADVNRGRSLTSGDQNPAHP
ncbi:MAG: acyltransferase [Caulobacteraceae bacterium]|nr:acyltransferase [Caulobacteraceae bacterium]